MNDREKRERVSAAGVPAQRLVLAVVLMHLVDGWCTVSQGELARVCGMPRRTFQRHLAALIPEHLERVVQRPNPSALKPSQRAIAVARSTRQREARSMRHPGGALPRARVDPRPRVKNTHGEPRVRNAAELQRLLRGDNVVEITTPRPKKKNPPPPDPTLESSTRETKP